MAGNIMAKADYPHPVLSKMEWRAAPGALPFEISEYGHVRRTVATRESPVGKVLRPWRTPNGYWQYHLNHKGKRHAETAHRLVAFAFFGENEFLGAQVAHRDDDKDNNHFSNLYWATPKQNAQDKRKNGRMACGDRQGARLHPETVKRGQENVGAKLTDADVRLIRATVGMTQSLAFKFGVSKTVIKNVRAGRAWKHIA